MHNRFAQRVNDAISNLKQSAEYEPGKEVRVVVPLKGKTAKLAGVELDDAKINYIDEPYTIAGADGDVYQYDPSTQGMIACVVTGRIR